jgi:hypothetical protein
LLFLAQGFANPSRRASQHVSQDDGGRGTIAEHGLINANQVMAFEDGSLWLPILDDGVVLRVTPPA